MKLRARVKRVTGATKHFLAHIENGKPVRDAEFPAAVWVEIQPEGNAFFLFYLDENMNCFTDTWHQTLEQAKRQAAFEFEIGEDDWEGIG